MGRRNVVALAANNITARDATSQAVWGAKGGLGPGPIAARRINQLETNVRGFSRARHMTLSELKRLAVANAVTGGVRGYRTLTG